MSERKAVIKNADMSEEMQQDAVDCATQALEKYNIEKVCPKWFLVEYLADLAARVVSSFILMNHALKFRVFSFHLKKSNYFEWLYSVNWHI